jgi:hypothetical protein
MELSRFENVIKILLVVMFNARQGQTYKAKQSNTKHDKSKAKQVK